MGLDSTVRNSLVYENFYRVVSLSDTRKLIGVSLTHVVDNTRVLISKDVCLCCVCTCVNKHFSVTGV